jgi:hypothetical protein
MVESQPVASSGKIHGHTRAAVACAGAAVLAVAPAALADTYRPDKRNDNGAGGLSLREAVTQANAEAGNDRIVLKSGETYTLSIPGATEDAAATGDLDINGDSLKVMSRGKPATIDADDVDRVFDVGPVSPATAIFKRLIITGGSSPIDTDGGGVQVLTNAGARVIDTTINANRATGPNGKAGGIDVDGAGANLLVNRSTVSNNRSGDNGGGIEVENGASLVAINSTVAGNRANEDGGGFRIASAAASLNNVTVARNQANADDAGGHDGGGLSESGGSAVTVSNSIIALHTVLPGGGGVSPDCEGAFTSAGVNLFTFLDATCTGFAVPPNLVAANPRLTQLRKSSGCLTKTVDLRSGSPAINASGANSPNRDQCGVKRTNPDVGARER